MRKPSAMGRCPLRMRENRCGAHGMVAERPGGRLRLSLGQVRRGNLGKRRKGGVCFGSRMRLVTFDRRGHRRLGAILGGEVVDLPEAVGHPAFPTTLEALVSSSGGSVMDAARAALERDDAYQRAVIRARVLPPLFPRSLLAPGALDVERRIVGPEDDVPWPEGAAWLDYVPMVAAVLGREASVATAEPVRGDVFGYTLVSDWK